MLAVCGAAPQTTGGRARRQTHSPHAGERGRRSVVGIATARCVRDARARQPRVGALLRRCRCACAHPGMLLAPRQALRPRARYSAAALLPGAGLQATLAALLG